MAPRTSFKVHRTRDGRLLLESALTKDPKDRTLVISRDGNVVLEDAKLAFPTSVDNVTEIMEVYGVLGMLELSFAKYLIVATDRSLAATVQSHKIWKITQGAALALGSMDDKQVSVQRDLDAQSLAKYELDQDLLNSIMEIVNSGHLYYSPTYDITHSLQHNQLLSTGRTTTAIIDDRYFFNKHLAKPFLEVPKGIALPWICKTICGFAGMIEADVGVGPDDVEGDATLRTYNVALISRLNSRRLGTRYVRRGLDADGNAANNVEMEQIVFDHDFDGNRIITSFAQIRGSVPGLWGQDLDLSYRPKLLIADIKKPQIWEAILKHYTDLRQQYVGEKFVAGGKDEGKVVCVNLLDDKGFEGELTKMYEASVLKVEDERLMYEEFPVNKWCKKMNFRNMDILLDRVRDRLINSGLFVAEGEVPSTSGKGSLRVSRLQTGVLRVSCLDSLDRTNLTCTMFARYILPFQVQSINPSDFPASSFLYVNGANPLDVRDPVAAARKALAGSSSILTNLWADSGDAISLLYAGTRALKADVTRTGERQWLKGSFDDGLNALTRYYLNNFVDGVRQDAYDLWTGKVSLEQIYRLASTEGMKKAQQLQKPVISKGQGVVGRILPAFVVDRIEPLLQAATDYAHSTIAGAQDRAGRAHQWIFSPRTADHISSDGSPKTAIGFLVSAAKIYAPGRVATLIDFIGAMVVFVYVLAFVKVFHLNGKSLVGRPKLSIEHETIHELVD